MKLLEKERIDKIYKLLQEKGYLKYQDIVKLLKISPSTVRRDTYKMEKLSLCNKISGGIEKVYEKEDESYCLRTSKNLDKKKKIASIAKKYLKNSETIYLDSGSTILEIIPYLKNMNIKVVTNCIGFIEILLKNNISVILLGGQIKEKTKCIIGSTAYKQLSNYSFDKCFIGANGYDDNNIFSTPDPEEASLKKLAIENSKEKFILCDTTKKNKKYFAVFSKSKNIKLITEESK